jgi:hypothetical protein
MTMTTFGIGRAEPAFPKRLFLEQAMFATAVWAGFMVFVLLLTIVVSLVREIDVSGWNLAGQPARWFGFVIGIYVGYTLFPLYVTHGGTRRGHAIRSALFTLAYGGLMGLLLTLGFPIEAALYAAMGWPQALHETQLFAGPLDLPMILVQWVLIMTLWVAGGLFIGAAWYRNPAYGAFAIVLGIFFAGISGMAIGGNTGPHLWVYQQLLGGEKPGTAMAVILHLASIAMLLGLTWATFKDAPIHNKSE